MIKVRHEKGEKVSASGFLNQDISAQIAIYKLQLKIKFHFFNQQYEPNLRQMKDNLIFKTHLVIFGNF